MGVVYKAEDTALKRTVALKFLSTKITGSDEYKARFVREAQLAASLDHTNICTIYEINEAEEQTFIAMAHVEGETLAKRIEEGPLELDEAVALAMQVAEGLQEAHGKGIVHRDIKTANIMITPKGRAKIMDFGLAKVAEGTEITGVGARMGTVAYMSPEQARGEDVDHRTDLWSLGVILYEMISGQRPFKGEYGKVIVYFILNEEPVPVGRIRSDVPLELERIVDKALAKRADDRYESAAGILAELRAFRDSGEVGTTVAPFPVRSRTPTPLPPAPRPQSPVRSMISALFKKRKLVINSAVVCLLVIGTILVMIGRRSGLRLDPNRVVVAVFENRTGDDSLDYLGRVAADWITAGLSQMGIVETVQVMTVSQASRATGVKTAGLSNMSDIGTLAEYTEAGTVVAGAYSLDGENIRFQAQIVDAHDKRIVSVMPSVSGPREDPMEAIDTLRRRIMGALGQYFDADLGILVGSPPPLFEAYREYIVGKELFGTQDFL